MILCDIYCYMILYLFAYSYTESLGSSQERRPANASVGTSLPQRLQSGRSQVEIRKRSEMMGGFAGQFLLPIQTWQIWDRNWRWWCLYIFEKKGNRYQIPLPKTNSPPLKIGVSGHQKRKLVFQHLPTIHFQGRLVSFRECNSIPSLEAVACGATAGS